MGIARQASDALRCKERVQDACTVFPEMTMPVEEPCVERPGVDRLHGKKFEEKAFFFFKK